MISRTELARLVRSAHGARVLLPWVEERYDGAVSDALDKTQGEWAKGYASAWRDAREELAIAMQLKTESEDA